MLLASRGIRSRKPILIISLTNHALDNFLSDLRDAGIVTFARMGAGSKESWTQEFDHRKQTQKLRKTTFEQTSSRSAHLRVEGEVRDSVENSFLNTRRFVDRRD